MAFIKIQKADKIIKVTRSAFLNYFSNMGWTEADEKASGKPKKEDKKESNINNKEDDSKASNDQKSDAPVDEWDEVMNEDDEDDEDVQKPLSEMSKKELIELANEKGIDTTGMNTNQIREALK